MTVLTRLYQKGFAQREKDGRQFVYSIGTSGKKAGENFLSRVKATFFQNQKLKPILTLIEDGDELSKDELMELKRVIQDKLAQGKKG
jgi:predicted transcriptional regulator